MEPSTEQQLDEQTALDVMGWVRGGPDEEFWCLGNPPAGLTSVFRMPVTRWRPTRDAFCLELLVEEMRSHGLVLDVAEAGEPDGGGYTCTVSGGEAPGPVTVSAPTAGMAVVCAALAHRRGRG